MKPKPPWHPSTADLNTGQRPEKGKLKRETVRVGSLCVCVCVCKDNKKGYSITKSWDETLIWRVSVCVCVYGAYYYLLTEPAAACASGWQIASLQGTACPQTVSLWQTAAHLPALREPGNTGSSNRRCFSQPCCHYEGRKMLQRKLQKIALCTCPFALFHFLRVSLETSVFI